MNTWLFVTICLIVLFIYYGTAAYYKHRHGVDGNGEQQDGTYVNRVGKYLRAHKPILNRQYLLNNMWYGENSREQNLREHQRALFKSADMRLVTTTWATPDLSRVWGIDISGRWNGNVDLAATKAAGAAFVIGKVMDGTVPSRCWLENRQRGLDAGLIVGDYGWLYPDKYVRCKEQAQKMFERVRTVKKQLPLMIDFEWTKYNGVQANPTYADLDIWTTEFIRVAGYKAMLYTAAGYCNPMGKMPAELRDKFSCLVVANYGVLVPMLPLGWPGWGFHQFASSGEARVIAPNDVGKLEVDLDYFVGDLESLQKFAGVTVTPTPEPGETMWYRVTATVLNIRNGPGGAYQDIGDLLAGDVIEVTETLGGWHHFKSVWHNGVGLNVTNPDSWCSAVYTVVTDAPIPPDEIAIPDYIVAHWVATGKTTKYVPE